MSGFEQQGFPEGYDPKKETQDILKEDTGDLRHDAFYDAMTRHSNAEKVINTSRNSFLQGAGLTGIAAVMASPVADVAANFPQHLANAQEAYGTPQGDILLGTLTAFMTLITAGSAGIAVQKILGGIRTMRQARIEQAEAKQDVGTFGGNTEEL